VTGGDRRQRAEYTRRDYLIRYSLGGSVSISQRTKKSQRRRIM
jgi:hypothetical protein